MPVEPTKREHELAEELDRNLLDLEQMGLGLEEHTATSRALIAEAFAKYRVEKDARLAEVDAELAAFRMQVTDFADDILGLQEVAPVEDLLSRVGRWCFEMRQERGRLEAELARIRERARAEIAYLTDLADPAVHHIKDVVGDLGGEGADG